jgi:hypothetical protein
LKKRGGYLKLYSAHDKWRAKFTESQSLHSDEEVCGGQAPLRKYYWGGESEIKMKKLEDK